MSVRDIIQGAAGATESTPSLNYSPYVEDVFSTYLYAGNYATNTINNGLDLVGKGGMVWFGRRSAANNKPMFDSETLSMGQQWFSDYTTIQPNTDSFISFQSNGFTLGADSSWGGVNGSGEYVSWAFRRGQKFFDVVSYTGNGTTQTINHGLNQEPGMIIVKDVTTWGTSAVYHRSQTAGYFIQLENTNAQVANASVWNNTTPTSTSFSVGGSTYANESGRKYVAYLFADDSAVSGLIRCGAYTGATQTVTLGWEPQFVMIKCSSSSGNWVMLDSMRGIVNGYADMRLHANDSTAETNATDYIKVTPTGFTVTGSNTDVSKNSTTFVYMAIRRGPMRSPTDASKVFQPVAYTGTNADNRVVTTGIVTDLVMAKNRAATSAGFWFADRMRGDYFLQSGTTAVEATDADSFMPKATALGNSFSVMSGFCVGNDTTRQLNQIATNQIAYAFRRAPGFFDVACWQANNSGSTTFSHGLGAVPEFIIVKTRSGVNDNWFCYHKYLSSPTLGYVKLNDYFSENQIGPTQWAVSSTSVTVASTIASYAANCVSYLFASLSGVSKVGKYTGTGTTQQINCGFTNGARFVLIKRIENIQADWFVWDSARGIVSGNDPYLTFNAAAAEAASTDFIDPYSAGFEISSTAPATINGSGGTFIYFAIA